jgi:P27 family predicted phage terminase small subunit
MTVGALGVPARRGYVGQMANRTRIPTAIKELRGNPSKKRLNKAEPKPTLAAAPPPPPEYLDAVAAAEWERLARSLWLNSLLGAEDVVVFSAYCEAFSDWQRYNGMIAEQARRERAALEAKLAFDATDSRMESDFGGMVIATTNGNWVMNPVMGLRNVARRECIKFGTELGLTPCSRSRINVPRGSNLPGAPDAPTRAPKAATDFLNRPPRDNVVPLKA